MNPLAIYLHVPFCARKCAYCDFASFSGRQDVWQPYFTALHSEIDAWADELCAYEAHSIFFGGGTPSLVPAEYITAALSHLHSRISFAEDAEITIEANPGTLTPEKLQAYRAAGVNRISIGVQSFDAGLLKALGRIHTPEEAAAAVHMAREAGFANISIDLMYALPGQSMAQWQESLARAVSLPVNHISAYSLIVEEGTPLHRAVMADEVHVPDDDAAIEMQRMAVAYLASQGFERYEISNFARSGFESRHNMTYWLGGEYLGLGSAAHSLMGNERFSNPPRLERYLAGERMLDRQARSLLDQQEEALMLETRMLRGLDLAAWQARFGHDLLESRSGEIRRLADCGLVEIQDGFLRLTSLGLELQDSVVLELM